MNVEKIKERLFRELFLSNLLIIGLFTLIMLIIVTISFEEFFYISITMLLLFLIAMYVGFLSIKRFFYPYIETADEVSLGKKVDTYQVKKAFIELKTVPFYYTIITIFAWLIAGFTILFAAYSLEVISLVKFILIGNTYFIVLLVSGLFQWYFFKNSVIQPLRILGEKLLEEKNEETLRQGLYLPLRSKIFLIFIVLISFSAGIISMWGIGQVNRVRKNINITFMRQILSKALLATTTNNDPQHIISKFGKNLFLSEISPKGEIISGEIPPSFLLEKTLDTLPYMVKDDVIPSDQYLAVISPPLDNGSRYLIWKKWNNFPKETMKIIKDYLIIFFSLIFLVGSIIYLAANDWRGITNALKTYLARVRRGNFRKGIIIYADDELGDIGAYLNQVHDFFKNSISDARQLAVFIENNVNSAIKTTSLSFDMLISLQLIINEILKISFQQRKYFSTLRNYIAEMNIKELDAQHLQTLTIATGKTKGTINNINAQANFIKSKLEEDEKNIATLELSLKIIRNFTRKFKGKTDQLIETVQNITTNISSIEVELKRIKIFNTRNSIFLSRVNASEKETIDSLEFMEKRLEDLYANLQELEKVLSFIYELSEDTKILSLNASIISSHAEEEGKRFSVIANHIQTLARISGESIHTTQAILHEISHLRENVIEKTRTFKKNFQQLTIAGGENAPEVLSTIPLQIEKLLSMIQELSTNTRELFTTIEAIDNFVDVLESSIKESEHLTMSYLEEIKKITSLLEDMMTELHKAIPLTATTIENTQRLNTNALQYSEKFSKLVENITNIETSAEELENKLSELATKIVESKDLLDDLAGVTDSMLSVNDKLKRLLIKGFRL